MSPRRRPWTSIATAVVIGGCGLIFAVGVRAILFIYTHVQERPVTPQVALSELTAVTARFAGQQPLIELLDGREPTIRRGGESRGTTGVTTLYAVIYDARSGRLINDDISLRVLRVFKSRGFRYLGELTPMRDDTEFERDRVDVTLEDIEHHGASLVLDHRHGNGSQIIIWVE